MNCYSSQEHGASSLHGPPKSSYESGDSESKWRPKPLPVSQKTSVSGVFSSLNEYLNAGGDRKLSTLGSQISQSHDEPEKQQAKLEVYNENISSQASGNAHSQTSDHVSLKEKDDFIDSDVIVNTSSVVVDIPPQSENCLMLQNIQKELLSGIVPAEIHTNVALCEEVKSSMDDNCHENATSGGGITEEERNMTSNLNADKAVLSFGSVDVSEELDDEALDDYLSDLELEEQQYQQESKPLCDLGCEDVAVAVPRAESQDRSGIETKISLPEQSMELSQSETSLSINVTDEVQCSQEDHSVQRPSLPIKSNTDFSVSLHNSQLQPVSQDTPTDTDISIVCKMASCSPLETKENSSDLPQEANKSVSELSSAFVEELCENALLEQRKRMCQDTSSSAEGSCEAAKQKYVPDQSSCLQDKCKDASLIDKTENDLDQTITASSSACSTESEETSHSQSLSTNTSVSSMEETNSPCLPETIDEDFTQEYESPEPKPKKDIQLSLSIEDSPNGQISPESPATPPTVPVTPTFQDPSAIEECISSLSASSTPFMTPTAVCSEPSEFIEGLGQDDTVVMASASEPVVNSEHVFPDTSVGPDVGHKPIRPSSLEIPVRTESVLAETAGSSEDSPSACNATIG